MQTAVYRPYPVNFAVIDPCPAGTKRINLQGGIEIAGTGN